MAQGGMMMETAQSGPWKLHQTENLWRFSYSTPWGPWWGGVIPNNQTLEIKTQYWNAFNANGCVHWCVQSTRNHSYIVKRTIGKQKTPSVRMKNFYFVRFSVLVSWFARPIPNLNKCDVVSRQAELLCLPDKTHPRLGWCHGWITKN